MPSGETWVVVGLDNGGNKNNATVLDSAGRFLVDDLLESPSRVTEGPEVAVEALVLSFDDVLRRTGVARERVRAVGLDTPGPASATGVITARGSTNFAHPAWGHFDFRGALETRLSLPVVYNNDGNAAALYAHYQLFGALAPQRSSISAIIGTGLGGGVIEKGQVIKGAAGFAGELGHVHIPMHGPARARPAPAPLQLRVRRRRGERGLPDRDREEPPALLVHPLSRPSPLKAESVAKAAKLVRGYGEQGDPLALAVFEQQAKAVGRLFTIAANFTDPDAYFLGGGVVEAAPHFRQWFLGKVREHTVLRAEQVDIVRFEVVPDLDKAGARGAAIAALEGLHAR